MTYPRLIAAAIGLVVFAPATTTVAAPRHGGPPAHVLTANYNRPGNLTGMRKQRLHPASANLPRARNTAHS